MLLVGQHLRPGEARRAPVGPHAAVTERASAPPPARKSGAPPPAGTSGKFVYVPGYGPVLGQAGTFDDLVIPLGIVFRSFWKSFRHKKSATLVTADKTRIIK